jgi:hypothetical protein
MSTLNFNIPIEYIILFAANFLLILILFLMNASNRSKYRKLKAKYDRFFSGTGEKNGQSLEELLNCYIDNVSKLSNKSKEIENHINYIERNVLQCTQKVGIIRYNAFENMGSDLSFSIALLDNNDNGLTITGIYSRESSSTYAKPIVAGKSKYALSAEEIQAIEVSKKSFNERLYTEK